MTVCIASLSENGQACVVCADRQVTNPGMNLTFEASEPKIETLTATTIAMASGDSALAGQIVERARRQLSAATNPSVQQIAEVVRDTYMRMHIERAESVILVPRGWTFADFRNQGAQQIPLDVYKAISDQIFNFGLNVVDLIVAGLDATGGHIFRVYYTGMAGGNWIEWYDRAGYRAVGAGGAQATISLAQVRQHRGLSTADTLYNVYDAKKIAEAAPGVGSATDLLIISGVGIEVLDPPLITQLDQLRTVRSQRSVPQAWRDAYNNRPRPSSRAAPPATRAP